VVTACSVIGPEAPVDMARWRRKPTGTTVHSDRGTQYTSWLFGNRLREAGLLGSMGKVASAYDNALMESFFGGRADLQRPDMPLSAPSPTREVADDVSGLAR
jgi:transposase InsO family protein